MTPYVFGAAAVLVLAPWLLHLVLGYKAHVDYPDLRKRWARLPEPKKGRAA